MKVAIIYTSMSGNTKLFGELIKSKLEDMHNVDLLRLEVDGVPDVKKYDALILGTYTWIDGSLPEIHKDFAYEIQHKPEHVFIFGTGETQFGERYYCNAAKKLHKYYESKLEIGIVEQTPTDSQEVIALEWIEKLKGKLGEIEMEKERIQFLEEMGVGTDKGELYQKMYRLQKKFDDALNEKRNIDFSNSKYLRLNNFALLSELGELLDELDWPWWKVKEFNEEGALNELRDLQHFILKSMILLDIKEDDYLKYIVNLMSSEKVEVSIENKTEEEIVDMYTELLLKRYTTEDYTVELDFDVRETITELLTESVANFMHSQAKEDDMFSLTRNLFNVQTSILLYQRFLGYEIEDAFNSYVDKNIENHNRQKGKSKDATRTNYSDNTLETSVTKEGDNFIVTNKNGEKVIITKETLFEMNRM